MKLGHDCTLAWCPRCQRLTMATIAQGWSRGLLTNDRWTCECGLVLLDWQRTQGDPVVVKPRKEQLRLF
jgi:hypothetical protein